MICLSALLLVVGPVQIVQEALDTSLEPCASPFVPDERGIPGNPNTDATDPRFACGLFGTVIDEQHDPPATSSARGADFIEIPVVFHVLETPNGTGHLPDEVFHSQIRVLNEDFGAYPGTPGEAGVETGIRFVLASVDPEGNRTTGITRTVNRNWYFDGGLEQFGEFLSWDPYRYMNVFTNDGGGRTGYIPYYPQQSDTVGSIYSDYIVVNWTTVGRPALGSGLYARGRSLTHEVGHWLGLKHPFDGGCFEAVPGACHRSGDLICDTNAVASPTMGCPAERTSCGLPTSFRNYMDYTSDRCKEAFTPEQANRMRCVLNTWRAGMGRRYLPGDLDARADVRNVEPNPYAFWTGEPWIGETFDLFVDARGYSGATVRVSAAPAERTLSLGVLLVETARPPLLRLALAGPSALGRVLLPNVPALVGKRLYAQALLVGGAGPALTNAVDLSLGLR